MLVLHIVKTLLIWTVLMSMKNRLGDRNIMLLIFLYLLLQYFLLLPTLVVAATKQQQQQLFAQFLH